MKGAATGAATPRAATSIVAVASDLERSKLNLLFFAPCQNPIACHRQKNVCKADPLSMY